MNDSESNRRSLGGSLGRQSLSRSWTRDEKKGTKLGTDGPFRYLGPFLKLPYGAGPRPEPHHNPPPLLSHKSEEAKRKRRPQQNEEDRRAASTMSSMLSALSQWLVNPRRNPLARLHMHAVSARLRKYGLRYDDLYDPYHDLDIKEALARLPREVVDARIQRLKRAMDLSMKHQYLPDNLQALQTPFRGYLSDMLALVKRERAEREALGALPLYQRTIP